MKREGRPEKDVMKYKRELEICQDILQNLEH
jgi:hypothetical protein